MQCGHGSFQVCQSHENALSMHCVNTECRHPPAGEEPIVSRLSPCCPASSAQAQTEAHTECHHWLCTAWLRAATLSCERQCANMQTLQLRMRGRGKQRARWEPRHYDGHMLQSEGRPSWYEKGSRAQSSQQMANREGFFLILFR